MNSSVTLRPAPASLARAADGVSFTRMPAASQITLYSGTSAKPNAKLPATMTTRLRVSERLLRRVDSSTSVLRLHDAGGDERHVDGERDQREQDRGPADAAPLLVRRAASHVLVAHLTTGASSKV